MDSLADLGTMPAVEPMEPTPYRVTHSRRETVDVTTLTLVPVAAGLASVLPGQYLMVWAFGVGEIPISVSRTLPTGEVLLTVRAVGATSTAVVGTTVGDVLGLRGPFGTAWPLAAAAGRDLVVEAGGLGLAPLRMAIDAQVAQDPTRLSVVVGAREQPQLLYADDLQRWTAAGARVHLTVDAAGRSWHGAVGTTTAVLERLAERHEMAFVCGPELMMTSGARAVVGCGVQPSDIWVSLERNMHCGIGHCGRCQLGSQLLCRDGAVVRWDHVERLLEVRGR